MTVMPNLDATTWVGALSGWPRGEAGVAVRAVVQTYTDGSRASLTITSDSRRYWVKCVGNPQGDRILVTERIVSGVGELIDAPVRPTALIWIPEDLAGTSYAPGYSFHAGIAHGSLHLESAEESDDFLYPRRDHNAERRAALAALWDWCMGDDAQWIYDHSNESSIWSFDHGFWFGGDGGDWDAGMLERLVDVAWQSDEPLPTASKVTLHEVADRLESVTANQILGVLASVPREWGASDHELEVAGWFLFRRKAGVAQRLRAIK